jgi:hypothetical protein
LPLLAWLWPSKKKEEENAEGDLFPLFWRKLTACRRRSLGWGSEPLRLHYSPLLVGNLENNVFVAHVGPL